MSSSFRIESDAQPSLYNPIPRKIDIYFSIPDTPNDATGLLILLAGFGGNALSNVFKKMREQFADKYNMVTIQTNYFGWQYMQLEKLKETPSCFCDMGPVQAMDNLIALMRVKEYLHDGNIPFDEKNAVAYGFSHGAYLCHVMNCFMPEVLSCVIDNSSWMMPVYLFKNRLVYGGTSDIFSYIIKDIAMDQQIYSLQFLYEMRKHNKASVISFHGVNDELCAITDKFMLGLQTDNFSLEAIGPNRVDGKKFKSDTHGLDSDFIELFDYVMRRYKTASDSSVLQFVNQFFETDKCKYWIDLSNGIPQLYYDLLYDYDFDKLAIYS